jgi:hypothetical protein
MSRAGVVVQNLGLWARALSTSTAAAAVSTTSTQPGGALGFMGKKMAVPPMNVPLEGVDRIMPAPVSTSTPPTEMSSLANGVRIGVQDVMV